MTVKKTANMEIKKKNHSDIFQLLRKSDGLTKQEIVNTLQLCLPTVTQNFNDLSGQGLVTEYGTKGNTGGRRAKLYGIVKDAHVAVGIDITRNHVAIVAVDLTGSICYKKRVRRKFEETDDYYRYLGELVDDCIRSVNITPERVLGVGIGVPGLVTADNQTVFYGEILHFTGATCSQFSRYISYPTVMLNDAKAAGFAETWIKPDIKTAFYLMLSNNIGGAVIMNGSPYMGSHFRSGEVGHICIERNGRKCYCGQRGCVDCYLAATELSDLTDGKIAGFFSLLAEGDPEAKARWDSYLDHLAFTVNNVYMLFDCPIILGGYVGEYLPAYMGEIKERARKYNSFETNADYLLPCMYRTEAIAAGSALHFITQFLESI